MTDSSLSLISGTVDLLILKALSAEPRHGYAISEWVGATTRGELIMEEGTLYPALHRLENKALVQGEWGLSDNNRRAKFYRLTPKGRRHLARESQTWSRYSAAIAQALGTAHPNT